MHGRAILITVVAVGLIVLAHAMFALVRKRSAAGAAGAKPQAAAGWRAFRALVYLAWVIAIVAAAYTGFASLLGDEPHEPVGWLLWWHLIIAGAFVVLMLLVAVMWSGGGAGGAGGAASCEADPDLRPQRPQARLGCCGCSLERVSFWVMIVAAMVSLGTMMLNMLPIASTQQIELLVAIHGYSGLAVAAAAAVHLYTFAAARVGLQ